MVQLMLYSYFNVWLLIFLCALSAPTLPAASRPASCPVSRPASHPASRPASHPASRPASMYKLDNMR